MMMTASPPRRTAPWVICIPPRGYLLAAAALLYVARRFFARRLIGPAGLGQALQASNRLSRWALASWRARHHRL